MMLDKIQISVLNLETIVSRALYTLVKLLLYQHKQKIFSAIPNTRVQYDMSSQLVRSGYG